jgi:ABC-type Fe3+-hydroxamate transport system substrate-binding protein
MSWIVPVCLPAYGKFFLKGVFRMKTKKVLAMLLALVMLFALAACGKDSANKTDGETAQSEPVQAPETTQPETTATEETESKTEEPETTEPEMTEIEPYTVTDTKGNTATFTKVPERVIVINRYNTELLRATGHLDRGCGRQYR